MGDMNMSEFFAGLVFAQLVSHKLAIGDGDLLRNGREQVELAELAVELGRALFEVLPD